MGGDANELNSFYMALCKRNGTLTQSIYSTQSIVGIVSFTSLTILIFSSGGRRENIHRYYVWVSHILYHLFLSIAIILSMLFIRLSEPPESTSTCHSLHPFSHSLESNG